MSLNRRKTSWDSQDTERKENTMERFKRFFWSFALLLDSAEKILASSSFLSSITYFYTLVKSPWTFSFQAESSQFSHPPLVYQMLQGLNYPCCSVLDLLQPLSFFCTGEPSAPNVSHLPSFPPTWIPPRQKPSFSLQWVPCVQSGQCHRDSTLCF